MSIGQASSHVKPLETRDEAFYRELLGLSKVPVHLHNGLIRYLLHGVRPGSFLLAVLQNDAAGAVRRADPASNAGILHLFSFLIAVAPPESWGSGAAVAGWIADRQERAVTA